MAIEKLNSNAEVKEVGDKYLYGNHVRYPIALDHGKGVRVWDKDGNEYLDFLGGIAVNGLGYAHPAVVDALVHSAETITHCTNYFYNEPAVLLAKMLVENSCFDRVLYANSGAEANEALIKLARKYQKDHGHPERYKVLTFYKCFHGRTMATLTATAQRPVQQYFEPLVDGFVYADLNDIESVKKAIQLDQVAAILVEPVQGEGGVNPCKKEFLQQLRDLCDEKGMLLLYDEVQSGMGRLGTLFAYQAFGVEPDAVSMAKALGSGVPIGAIAAKGDAAETLTPGTHGSTFAGNPLVTSVALATVDQFVNHGVLENCQKSGEYLREKLNEIVDKHPKACSVRGMGLLDGLVLEEGMDGHVITDKMLVEKHVIVNCTAGNVLRFIPSLIVTTDDIDEMIQALDETMTELGF